MTPNLDPSLRAKLHRLIDEIFAAASTFDAPSTEGSNEQAARQVEPALRLVERLRELEPPEEEPTLQIGDLLIDLAGHEVFASGRRIRLTHREFALLRHLARNRGRACSREELVVHVWGDRMLASARTVDIHIHRLRHKLGRPFTELLETLRGVGYKLRTSSSTRESYLRRTPREAAPPRSAHELEAPRLLREGPANLTVNLAQSP